jgi:purine-nucleoside phosphorylase
MNRPADDPYEAADASAAALAHATGVDRHDIAVVLGSGWAIARDQLGELVAEVPRDRLGGFPPVGVPGHGDTVCSYRLGARRVLVFTGRVHLYEGHHPNVVVHGVRTAIRAGCATVVLTNACGGVRLGLEVGAPVLIADHLNLTGSSPLTGPNDPRLGPRFPDMTAAYPERLRAIARRVDPTLAECVYGGFAGPAFETPAEVRMAARLGADLVGMSTVHETLAAVHAGAEVLGLSLVTNLAAGTGGEPLTHDEVLAAATAAEPRLAALLGGIVAGL